MPRKPLHQQWTDRDDDTLRRLWDLRLPATSIARRMGKSPVTIYARSKALGLPHREIPRRKRGPSALYLSWGR